jgi:hypothetical protein
LQGREREITNDNINSLPPELLFLLIPENQKIHTKFRHLKSFKKLQKKKKKTYREMVAPLLVQVVPIFEKLMKEK